MGSLHSVGCEPRKGRDKQKLKQRQEGALVRNCKTRCSKELWKSATPEVSGGRTVPLKDAM